jgi:hypothetical protein
VAAVLSTIIPKLGIVSSLQLSIVHHAAIVSLHNGASHLSLEVFNIFDIIELAVLLAWKI